MDLSFEEKYNALGRKETVYEGLFITAVKTTKIFCRPSCSAKKPLAKNVVFYKNVAEALENGFRPCKICKPMEKEGETPAFIKAIIEQIHANPSQKIKDCDLQKQGCEPNKVRRWFKKHHNMTFHNFQRLIRLNHGFQEIQKGKKIIDAAFDSGFDSLSGFTERHKSLFGAAPTKSEDKMVIYKERFSTIIGVMHICATDKGVCLLEFDNRERLDTQLEDLEKRLTAPVIPGKNTHSEHAIEEVNLYLSGKLKKFSVALDTPGTEFQRAVWKILQAIPYGETWSYRAQAEKMNRPKAVRAVANANGMNRVALIIPCHRVIGADGSLTGYAGGLKRKKWLLDLEQQQQF